ARAPAPPPEILDFFEIQPGLVSGAARLEADFELGEGRLGAALRAHLDEIALPPPIGRTPLDVGGTVDVAERRLPIEVERATCRLGALAAVRLSFDPDARRATLDRPTKLACDLAALGSPVAGRAAANVTRFEAAADGHVVVSAAIELSKVAAAAGPASIRG